MSVIGIIKLNSDKDKEDYDQYKVVRSESLYQKVAEFLKGKLKLNGPVDFDLVSDWVRYDKAVKNVLYVFISTLEEYLKRFVILNMEYKDDKFIYLNKERETFDIKMLDTVNKYDTFGGGIFRFFSKWIKKQRRNDVAGFTSEELESINKLRNKVMHMSFIALPIFKYKNLREDLKIIKDRLPEPWRGDFVKKIIACQLSGEGSRRKRLELKEYIIEEV
jgi:hypothetical protein